MEVDSIERLKLLGLDTASANVVTTSAELGRSADDVVSLNTIPTSTSVLSTRVLAEPRLHQNKHISQSNSTNIDKFYLKLFFN